MAHISSGGSNSQDVELNLAPIIDCFTVLITFMLASASFLAIGILDAGIAAEGAVAKSAEPPAISITVEIGTAQQATVKVTGKTTLDRKLAAKDGALDLDGTNETLGGVTKQYPDIKAVTLTADSAVEYQSVIKAMDSIRKQLPVVVLGGF